MASEKQSQRRIELRRLLELQWEKYDREAYDRPTDPSARLELRRDIERQALFIYLNDD